MISSPFRRAIGEIGLIAIFWAGVASAAPPASWDGLVQVKSKNVDYLYIRPGAAFGEYKAIMLDPTQVAFRKDGSRDFNRSTRGASRIGDADVRRAIDEAQASLRNIFEKRFRETGVPMVTTPAENVLRVFVGVGNVDVMAPENRSAGRGLVFSRAAGSATLVVEVRDSLSGELLGRAVDHGVAGDSLITIRNSATNWADFEYLFDEWAKISAKGFQRLIASTPVARK